MSKKFTHIINADTGVVQRIVRFTHVTGQTSSKAFATVEELRDWLHTQIGSTVQQIEGRVYKEFPEIGSLANEYTFNYWLDERVKIPLCLAKALLDQEENCEDEEALNEKKRKLETKYGKYEY